MSPHRTIALLVSCVLVACGGTAGSAPTDGSTPGNDSRPGAGVFSGGDQAPTSTGTIAYAQGNELRLVEPDGSGDHLVWAAPESGASGVRYIVTAPAWRPDGREIAFSSNHEEAYSILERDIYAVRPDGGGQRKLTNAPTREQAATYPRGSVRVTVQNDDVGSDRFTLLVQGADPQGVVVLPGSRETITVQNVADLGAGVQQGIAIAAGTYRWNGPTVDVKAGQTVDAPLLYIHGNSVVEAFAADNPFWRSDASKVGYVGPYHRLYQAPSNPPPGYDVFQPLVGTDAFFDTPQAEWGPTAPTASQLIASDGSDYADTYVNHILEMAEGATTRPAPVYSLDPQLQIVDLHWLRDGAGFLFAMRNSPLEYDVNIWEYRFATRTATQLTNVQFDGVVRRFAMSPDGSQIAFEMVDRLYQDSPVIGYCDLWIMNRDGSGARLLVKSAAYPTWNPLR